VGIVDSDSMLERDALLSHYGAGLRTRTRCVGVGGLSNPYMGLSFEAGQVKRVRLRENV